MEIHSAANLGPPVRFKCVGRSRTKQSERDACNINLIMAKYVKTGLIAHVNRFGGDYSFATSVSFHDAMNIVTKADSMFADLPAEVRRRFNGEPGEFLDFVQNPENLEEMRELGLAHGAQDVPPGSVDASVEVESAQIPPEVDAGGTEVPPTG